MLVIPELNIEWVKIGKRGEYAYQAYTLSFGLGVAESEMKL